MPNSKLANTVVKKKTLDELKKVLLNSSLGFDSAYVLQKAEEEINNLNKEKEFSSDSNYYKAMTLFEFDKGVLLLNSLPKLYITFGLEYFKNLQEEFGCTSPSERSLAEITTINIIRTLAVQKSIKDNMKNVQTRYDIQYIAIFSKELDRAQRHYLTSLQTLKAFKQPPFQLNVKAETAVVGQNQVVQTNEYK